MSATAHQADQQLGEARVAEPRASLATRPSSAWATLPSALRRFNTSLTLPNLNGTPGAGCPRLPLPFLLLLFHRLFAMRLDGEEQGRAQDEQLERDEDDRNPIHDFLDMLHGIACRSLCHTRDCAKTVGEITDSDSSKNSGSDDRLRGFPSKFPVKVQW